MKERHYNIQDAKRFGILEAIVLYTIRFWIEKNEANKKHFYDGKYWTYNSASAFSELFEEISAHQMRRILNSLKDQGAIIFGNYNKLKYDRSQWYALGPKLTDEPISENANSILQNSETHFAESLNGKGENAKPIPDIITDIKTDNNNNNKPQKNFKEIKQERGIMTLEELVMEAINEETFMDRLMMNFGREKNMTVDIMKYYIKAIYSHWKYDLKLEHNNRREFRSHLINTINRDIFGNQRLYNQGILLMKNKKK